MFGIFAIIAFACIKPLVLNGACTVTETGETGEICEIDRCSVDFFLGGIISRQSQTEGSTTIALTEYSEISRE